MIMEQGYLKKASDAISGKRLDCVLALLDLDGFPTASPISIAKNQSIGWLAFCTFLDGSKIKRIENCNRASVCLFSADPMYNISLVGTIEVITDPEVKNEMWYDDLQIHFSGPSDENYCVLKFTTERYNLLFDFEEVKGSL
ncbi:MAG: pyridoxamine 5'-phosphate oxidase family protein [Coriobacteriales bacterium]|jgi:general stress protein 26|nr:pyridoxamine 5'-phosphate oxidase family protein [Coriobacteriales bacterium]